VVGRRKKAKTINKFKMNLQPQTLFFYEETHMNLSTPFLTTSLKISLNGLCIKIFFSFLMLRRLHMCVFYLSGFFSSSISLVFCFTSTKIMPSFLMHAKKEGRLARSSYSWNVEIKEEEKTMMNFLHEQDKRKVFCFLVRIHQSFLIPAKISMRGS
jgi:hypothetical protein